MAYALTADLIARFGRDELLQLTDRSGVDRVDEAVVGAAIADAGASIDGYLAARYALPVAPTPALLTRIACDLARFYLHGPSATELVRKGFEDAQRILRDLADGRAVLAGAAVAVPGSSPAAPGGSVQVAAPERRVDAGHLAGFF